MHVNRMLLQGRGSSKRAFCRFRSCSMSTPQNKAAADAGRGDQRRPKSTLKLLQVRLD